MNWKKIGLALLTLDFVALTVWAAIHEPIGAALSAQFASLWGIQTGVDLVLALAFGTALMWRDAKHQGINPWPFAVSVLFTGSIGLLAYGVVRVGRGATAKAGLAPARA